MATHQEIIERTVQAYEGQHKVYLKEWNRKVYKTPLHLQSWLQCLPRYARLLDLGCGLGQDSRYLRRQGFWVVGLDLTWSFLTVARNRSRALPLVQADIRQLPFLSNSVHGVWAAASLIHTPKSKLKKILTQLLSTMLPGGVLGATFLHGKGSGFLSGQWISGRYISKWLKPELQNILQRAGWRVISLETVTNRERKGRWLNVIAELSV